MKTTLVFVPSFGQAEEVKKIKIELVKYFGTRLVENEAQNFLYLVLRDSISCEDKKVINAIVSGGEICVIIFESAEDFLGKEYIIEGYVTPKEQERSHL